MIGYIGKLFPELWTRSDVDNGFEVAVRILQVDEMIVICWPGGTFDAFQWLEDLPEVLVVAEGRVDGDRRTQHRGGDEDLDV